MFISNISERNRCKIMSKHIYTKRKRAKMKSISIRIDSTALNKLHVIANYEGRSANSEILILIRDAIEKYEEKHGEITFGKENGSK